MVFVLEKISEEDKKKYGFDLEPYVKNIGSSWVIDREREVFLIRNGGAGMGIGKYEIHYDMGKKVVNFYTDERFVSENRNTIFNVQFLGVPESLKQKIDLVKSDICECLKKHGYFANPEKQEVVVINLPNNSEISFKQDNN